MLKKVLVCYHFVDGKGASSGSGNVECLMAARNLENIRDLERKICEEYSYLTCVIMNIIDLEEEEKVIQTI